MAAYRFRVVYEADPMGLWRDIGLGADRTLAELQTAINRSVDLPQYHLWFFGTGDDYWASQVKFLRPDEYENQETSDPVTAGEMTYSAGETTIADTVDHLELSQDDFFCYLYDYANEWRFSCILRERRGDADDDTPVVVIDGEGSLDQYESAEGERTLGDPIDPSTLASIPDPVDAVLPDAAITVSDLREFERRDDVEHVLILYTVETETELLCERFAIQLRDEAYLLEKFPYGWEIMERLEGEDHTERERLAALAAVARDWHEEIASVAGQASGRALDARNLEQMNAKLAAELERKGYTEL